MSLAFARRAKCYNVIYRFCSNKTQDNEDSQNKFEPVFSFPTVRYIGLINRLKVYQLFGTALAVPGSGIMEMLNIVPSHTFFSTLYVGVTGAAVLSLGTLPFKNIIGRLYISEDNEEIKISSVDFWGRRKDRVIPTNDWIPLLEMPPKTSDAFYLTAKLVDGTTYTFPIKFGKVLNAKKMGQVLE